MHTVSIFLLESDMARGNLLKYRLTAARFTSVRLFPSVTEMKYQLSRHEIPHFLILGTEGLGVSPLDFLRRICSSYPSIRVIFYSREADSSLAAQLLEEGATDYILRNGQPDEGIAELIKNLGYLCKETHPVR